MIVSRLCTVVPLLALGVTLVSVFWLSHLEKLGPERISVRLDGDAPATLYLPPRPGLAQASLDTLGDARDGVAEDVGPPVVVLVHGIASDQAGMSVLARALVQADYAVLTVDLRGHGANRNPFIAARGRGDFLVEDLRAAVDFLRMSRKVDGARISVMGHSMGAGAALAYATRDPALDAAVLISGGREITGPYRPPNALFIYGAGDPARIRDRSAALASLVSGEEHARPGVLYGDLLTGTAVSHVEVARADHITILTSLYAARQIIGWLDSVYGRSRGTFFLRADPRLRVALIGFVAFVLLLPGLGYAIGRLSPKPAERPAPGRATRLILVASALIGTLPLVAVGEAHRLVSLEIGDIVVTHWFAAGAILLGWLALSGQLAAEGPVFPRGAQALRAAAVGMTAIYFLLTPFGAVFHHLGLTPERAVIALLLIVLLAPFQLAFHFLLRRGGTTDAAMTSLVGRGVVLAVLGLGVTAGVVPGVVLLMLPVLAILFLLFEVVSSSIYATSRSYVTPALLETAWLAWILAAVLPVTL